jgi:hypothetical protein
MSVFIRRMKTCMPRPTHTYVLIFQDAWCAGDANQHAICLLRITASLILINGQHSCRATWPVVNGRYSNDGVFDINIFKADVSFFALGSRDPGGIKLNCKAKDGKSCLHKAYVSTPMY